MTDTSNVEELISQLNEKTENDKTETVEPVQAARPNRDDFTEPPNDINAPKASEQIFNTDKAKGMAQTWLKWLNSLMKIGFPYFYRSTVLAKGDQERMAAFVRSHAGHSEKQMEEAISSDNEMWPVKTRFDRYLKACEEVPLSQEEIDYIAEPLSELIVKYRFLQLSPEWSLVIAVLIVMMPRFEPMIPGLSKVFTSASEKANQA